MFEKNKQLKGLMISIVGMLFTIVGMVLLAMKSPKILYLSFTLIGGILATIGFVILLKDNMKK